MDYATIKLEFSPDPLSETSPTYDDVTNYLTGTITWGGGKASDLDDPQAGGCSFTLNSPGRLFEPEYAAGSYWPNIRPMRRFKITLTTVDGDFSQGTFYATSWTPKWPAQTQLQQVDVDCVDGFGVLSNASLLALDPASAQTLADVQAADGAIAAYTLGDATGSTQMAAAVGDSGTYKSRPSLGGVGLIVGEAGTAATFTGGQCGRVPLSDPQAFSTGNAFSVEAVIQTDVGADRVIAAGPYNTSAGEHTFVLSASEVDILTAAGLQTLPLSGGADGDIHHIAATWDGSSLSFFLDGAVLSPVLSLGGELQDGSSNEYLYCGGSTHTSSSSTGTVQNVAFYQNVLTSAQIAAHAAAALDRGYAAESVGDRIAALATNALWSVAGISSSDHTAAPRKQVGQSVLDEIIATTKVETPEGLFYFGDDGDPAYHPWDDTQVVSTSGTFGDSGSEVRYTGLEPVYDDEVYNAITGSRDADGAATITAADTDSQDEFGVRGYDVSGLIADTDSDVEAVCGAIRDRFSAPMIRVASLDLNGANGGALAHIVEREIGDWIEIRRRSDSGTPLDIITQIIGKTKTFDVHGNLTCTWNLARGMNASVGTWRLGVSGYTELGSTAVLG